MSNWYTATEAMSMFVPPVSDRAIRKRAKLYGTDTERIGTVQRDGKPIAAYSVLFLSEYAEQLGRKFIEPERNGGGTDAAGTEPKPVPRSVRKPVARNRSEQNDAEREQFLARIADLQKALDHEQESHKRTQINANLLLPELNRWQSRALEAEGKLLLIEAKGPERNAPEPDSLPPDQAENDATPKEGEVPAKKRPWWSRWLVE